MTQRKDKTPDDTPAAAELVPQPHGGLLREGGTNKGGLGVLPSMVRQYCVGSFFKRVKIAEDIADGNILQEVPTKDGSRWISPSPRDRLAALDLLGKYGALAVVKIESDPPPERPVLTEAVLMELVRRYTAQQEAQDAMRGILGKTEVVIG